MDAKNAIDDSDPSESASAWEIIMRMGRRCRDHRRPKKDRAAGGSMLRATLLPVGMGGLGGPWALAPADLSAG